MVSKRVQTSTVNFDQYVRQVDISDGRVFLVKYYESDNTERLNSVLRDLADDLVQKFQVNLTVIAVKKLSDMRVFDDDQMERHGWIRKDRVFATKDEAFDIISIRLADWEAELMAPKYPEDEQDEST